MSTKTLIEFASDQMLTQLLVKERAKCLRRNRSDKNHHLDKECKLDELSTRKMLSRMMPPRYTWVRPPSSKRKKLPNSALSSRKNAEKALLLTLKRDEKERIMARPSVIWMNFTRILTASASVFQKDNCGWNRHN